MSLTSYRAAPSRVKSGSLEFIVCLKSLFSLGIPGSDLLSRALRHSTIGAESFHVRVRNGIGCTPLARATRSSKREEGLKARAGLQSMMDRCDLQRSRIKTGSGCRPLHGTNEIKPIELLVPLSLVHHCTYTRGLSTWWSTTTLSET